MLRLVMPMTLGKMTLVLSSRPPKTRLDHRDIHLLIDKCRKAMAVMISKNVGACPFLAIFSMGPCRRFSSPSISWSSIISGVDRDSLVQVHDVG